MQYMNNKKGVKLLAAIAVFAMMAAALIVVIPASDATGEATPSTAGIIFKDADGDVPWNNVSGFTNKAIGNQISVSFDQTTNTYDITGNLAFIATLEEMKAAKSDGSASGQKLLIKNYYSTWENDAIPGHAVIFEFTGTSSEKVIFFNDGRVKSETLGDTDSQIVLYVDNSIISTEFYVVATSADTSGITTQEQFDSFVSNASNNVTTIKVTGNVTLDTAKNYDKGYVAVENGNALLASSITSGTDTAGGKWDYNATTDTLTLNNYNGKEYFSADISNLVLVGDNSITLNGATNAIVNTGSNKMTIKSVDGVGSLAIDMESAAASEAIKSTGAAVAINGVDVSISMSEKYATAPTAANGFLVTKGIYAESFEIYDGSLNLDIAQDNYYKAYGIYTKAATGCDVDIKSSEVIINAGSRGIHTEGAGNVTIAASDVTIEADQLGIRTGTTTGKTISITNESNVDISVYGLAEGYYKAYGISSSGGIEVQSDSVLETDGMIVYGTDTTKSINNATIINNGEMVIWNGAVFENAGQFVNNGVVGVYGQFKNSAGETVNNGVLNTYELWRAPVYSGKSVTATDSVANKTITIAIGSMMPLADGTFLASLTTSQQGVEGTSTYVGTINFTLNRGYVIDALSTTTSDVLAVTFDSQSTTEKYNIYASQYTFSVTTDKAAETSPMGTDTMMSAVENPSTYATITVAGGKVTNSGSIQINDICTSAGIGSTAFITNGELVNNGDLEINASIETTGGKLNGNIATVGAGVTITFKGTIDMAFSHSSSYTTTVTGSSTPVITEFTDVIGVSGEVNGLVINTTAEPTMKGFVAISGMDGSDAKATVTVLEGFASITDAIAEDMVLSVASGATLQVTNSNATATAGVIAIQDGATFNMKVASDRDTYKYGTLTYTISFANEGYTYYGSLQYALANAAEGSTLNLDGTATITADTVVKKGITLVFADSVNLGITATADKKVTLSMEEGASFVLGKASVVTIPYTYATVSGTFVYDVNEVILDKAVFKTSNATITANAATSTAASNLGLSMIAIDGTVTVSKGTSTGSVTIDKTLDDSNKLKTTGKLIVSEDATAKIAFSDNDNKYAETQVDGKLEFSANTSINGSVKGDGQIVIADGYIVTFQMTASADITVGNGTDAFVFDDANSTVLQTNGELDTSKSKTFTVGAVAKTGTKAAYVTLVGDLINGTVTSQGNTAFGNGSAIFTLGTKAVAVVPADVTITIVKKGSDDSAVADQSKIDGLLKVAGTINMKIADVTESNVYGILNYQITYTEGAYTVYTMLSTGVSNATAGDSFAITEDLPVSDNMEIPAGVTLTIAEGKKITIAEGKYISIGSPITTLGATSSIEGTIQLEVNAFVIIYEDDSVDMSKAKIIDSAGSKAKNSQFVLLNQVYATVFVDVTANVDIAERNVKAALVPEIDGYRFLGWNRIVTAANIGSTDYEGNLKASMIQVTFQKVDGITYYVDNLKMNIVGAPVYIAYGSTVTAVADYGYSGTPLVNGKAYITIDNTTTTITGSGVSPTEPEPTPEPEKDDGMGITDYLLIVLVILAAILVVVVAIRMMRS